MSAILDHLRTDQDQHEVSTLWEQLSCIRRQNSNAGIPETVEEFHAELERLVKEPGVDGGVRVVTRDESGAIEVVEFLFVEAREPQGVLFA